MKDQESNDLRHDVTCVRLQYNRDRLGDGITRQPAGGALEILARVAFGEPVDPGEARQLLDAAAAADPSDFARALGVDRPTRIRMRDRALRAAAKSLLVTDPWRAAKNLIGALDRFESRVLPLLRKGRPLAELGDHEKSLLVAHWSATRRHTRIETLWRMFR